MKRTFLLALLLACGTVYANGGTPSVAPNDNRAASGRLHGGVLTVSLVARRGIWHPEGPHAPGIEVAAFGVERGALTNPGPVLRVPVGSSIRVSVHNTLLSPMTVHGFGATPLVVPSGETRATRFIAATAGTFFYWGTTTGSELNRRFTADAQLNGALVVDALGANVGDRVFVITHQEENQYTLWTINGAAWPATERLAYQVGDRVRWRWINASDEAHPLHLHGHYFRVAGANRLVSTQVMESGSTMEMTWTPERAGNWLFHCHVLFHIAPQLHLIPPPAGHAAMDPEHHMGGLVLGIAVAPRSAPLPEQPPARRLRLLVGERPGVRYGDDPGLGYALISDAATQTVTAPGPLIVLTRGEPVAITVENHLATPTSVHWHGIELESYYDGVPGWTGSAGHVSPSIAPGASFEAHITAPRAGTFMYHTHFDDYRQLSSGLYGPLIVLEPGASFDPATDRVFVLGRDGPEDDSAPLLVNGSSHPPALTLEHGVAYRLRFIGITPAPDVDLALTRGGVPISWRALAKDGAELPLAAQVSITAQQRVSAGETYDFEIRVDEPGDLRLEAIVFGAIHADTDLHVR